MGAVRTALGAAAVPTTPAVVVVRTVLEVGAVPTALGAAAVRTVPATVVPTAPTTPAVVVAPTVPGEGAALTIPAAVVPTVLAATARWDRSGSCARRTCSWSTSDW